MAAFAQYPAGSPVAINGKLQVKGTQLVNECGYPVQLRGMSSHGPQWFGNCICESSIKNLVNEWGISVYRIAMYVQEKGYVTNKQGFRDKIDEVVKICGDLGIYCLIDWHVLTPGNPNDGGYSDAVDFWKYMSQKHGSKKHVLYELCNEPNGCQWSDVKKYAENIIPIFRNNNDETVAIVGTPTWSQDVDAASQNKLNFSNVMYTLHFYAGSHGQYLMDKANTALRNGAPIFITEFGVSKADGNGGVFPNETRNWIKWANDNNVSFINWSYSDANETSGALRPGSCSGGQWNNTTDSGTLIKELIKSNPKTYTACNGQQQGGQEQGGQQQGGQQQGGQQQGGQQQGGQQQGGQQQGGQQQGGQQQGGQQQTQPVTYPDLTNSIAAGQGYRIVNKATGKVMSSNNKMEGDAPLVTVTRKEGDMSQIYVFKGVDEFFRLRNEASMKCLSNKYQPNDGTAIVQLDYNQWDESEKWKITLVNDKWFRIENKSVNNNNTCIASTGSNDGDAVKQTTWSNQDAQLWGLEKTDVDDSGVASFAAESLVFYPTIWGEEFVIEGFGFDKVIVSNISGVALKQFEAAGSYNVADLSAGIYFVTVMDGDTIIGRFKAIKK
ncbi:MAG: cellulase family glycosylhydrolase [Paludibacteraceae bacterium]|nr:cellulase family glycosylhydrolase [Paludibacteraceae bacterium]